MDHRTTADLVWSPAPADRFTGEVWFGPMLQSASADGLEVYGVMFEPHARTHWHRHPGGQTLYIVSGSGYVGNEDGEVGRLAPGDVVNVPPGEMHWHGAAPGSYLMHLSITAGGRTDWIGGPVTDDLYPR